MCSLQKTDYSSGTVQDSHLIPILITFGCEPIAGAKVSINIHIANKTIVFLQQKTSEKDIFHNFAETLRHSCHVKSFLDGI